MGNANNSNRRHNGINARHDDGEVDLDDLTITLLPQAVAPRQTTFQSGYTDTVTNAIAKRVLRYSLALFAFDATIRLIVTILSHSRYKW